ncbi:MULTISPECIES: hypothetical protein [Aeromonas]|uniref:hypothetical protein n=1 Tax=Aeromonas TaxID=642 RepID=UPI001495AF8E|nr:MULTISPECIES: hypothetical protein [Aeromonas]MBA8783572.1 hypothetical protein [Aeromonas caviae]MBA8787626.1 hypothetical protein [Aeromonas sp. TW 6]
MTTIGLSYSLVKRSTKCAPALVKLVFSIISGLAFVGSLLTWLLYEDYSMLPGFVMMGVTAALLAWAYDLLLGLLSPADMVNTL